MELWHKTNSEIQLFSELSFIGGMPMLPNGAKIPVYDKTGKEMTFFFQLQMPEGHAWEGRIISLFMATDYVDDNTYLPKLPISLKGVSLDKIFFEEYQTFFKILVFQPTDAFFEKNYKQVIEFHNLTNSKPKQPCILFGSITKNPLWILDDEAPNDFEGNTTLLKFLFQVKLDYVFKSIKGAPRQKIQNFFSGNGLIDNDSDEYSLFAANELYFFGVDTPENYIYIIPQS